MIHSEESALAMDGLQQTAARAFRELLINQPNTPAKVAFAWSIAAGPALGRAGAAEWAADGTLRVRARDAAWRREIRRARPIIAERLARLLGPGVVRTIVID
jgi:hypothetical protein